ncbi:MAG TPA: RsmE family RNA methyltransferase [Spirochaetia bacterium]|nr:RsmE family RNA methyltransferase [Spirochaetia bacterium]
MKQLVLPRGSRTGPSVELRGREHHYLVRVRRIAVGEQIAALDGSERLVLEVTEVHPDRLVLRVIDSPGSEGPIGPKIILFPFLLKARKLDDVVRQACEAGVSAIVPVVGDHCVSRPEGEDDGKHKAERWAAIAREAAQQSGNRQVCEVRPPVTSRDLVSQWTEDGPLLFFHQIALDKGNLHRYLFPRPEAVGLIVGPEGGLSPAEVALFRTQGALPVWLGPFVLRAETASLYAVAAVNTILQESPEWTIPM